MRIIVGGLLTMALVGCIHLPAQKEEPEPRPVRASPVSADQINEKNYRQKARELEQEIDLEENVPGQVKK